jgi:hypothetical protein
LSALPDLRTLERQLRVLAILAGARRAGISPLAVGQLHTIAYFADALAPVWGLDILDAQLLKRRSGPFSPVLQADIDHLVGIGVVTPTHVEHVRDEEGAWRLDASYQLNDAFAAPILERAMTFRERAQEVRFVEEVVLAVSSLSPEAIEAAAATDASYGDVEVAIDGLVDISQEDNEPNFSTRVALRFGKLMRSEVTLSPAEMVHLYVRELDKRLQRAA